MHNNYDVANRRVVQASGDFFRGVLEADNVVWAARVGRILNYQ